MNALTEAAAPAETLPALIDRATAALDGARSSAEVLEARDLARVAYDAAKSAGRMAKAKQAHDTLISEVHRAQAHALSIRARAEMRLAVEEIIPRKDLHEARQMRDAEAADPGIVDRAVNDMVDRGEEPTRAAMRRSVLAAVEDAKRKPSRKNPMHVKDEMRDRVFKFSGLCRSIAEFTDIEEIASWDAIPQTADRLPDEVRAAAKILSHFLEAKNA